MKKSFEKELFFNHGAPKCFSADHEFCRPVSHRFLDTHHILLNYRPSISSHKTGRIERKNGVFKMVLEKLQKPDENATPKLLVARASFETKFTRGSNTMSAFELVR